MIFFEIFRPGESFHPLWYFNGQPKFQCNLVRKLANPAVQMPFISEFVCAINGVSRADNVVMIVVCVKMCADFSVKIFSEKSSGQLNSGTMNQFWIRMSGKGINEVIALICLLTWTKMLIFLL